MTLFLDNDAMSKLASWNLLEEGVRACGYEMADVRYLFTARYALAIGRPGCKYSAHAQARMKELFEAGTACTDDPSDLDLRLPNVKDIDAGEAILFAQASRAAASILTTGDKRCIRAAATAPEFADVAKNLAGRVVCLEQVLLRIVDRIGFDEVKKRIVESDQRGLDTAVFAAFGSGMDADEMNACWNLERRVQKLAADSSGMLATHSYRFATDNPEDGDNGDDT